MRNILTTLVVLAASFFTACGSNNSTKKDTTMSTESNDAKVTIVTSMGPVEVLLYGDTPAHRDNFLKLAREGYYNGTLFHRVIKDFMVQAGDPDSRNAPKGQMLGTGGPSYNIDAEIVYPRHFHKRGALAAARQGDQVNPTRQSSGSQFYIVTGQVYNDSTLNTFEKRAREARVAQIFTRLRGENRDQILALSKAGDREGLDLLRDRLVAHAENEADQAPRMTPEQRQAYTTVGGTPHLDGDYTVFGEVLSGMEVIDAIQGVATDRNDRPVEDVKIIEIKVE